MPCWNCSWGVAEVDKSGLRITFFLPPRFFGSLAFLFLGEWWAFLSAALFRRFERLHSSSALKAVPGHRTPKRLFGVRCPGTALSDSTPSALPKRRKSSPHSKKEKQCNHDAEPYCQPPQKIMTISLSREPRSSARFADGPPVSSPVARPFLPTANRCRFPPRPDRYRSNSGAENSPPATVPSGHPQTLRTRRTLPSAFRRANGTPRYQEEPPLVPALPASKPTNSAVRSNRLLGRVSVPALPPPGATEQPASRQIVYSVSRGTSW